MIPPLLRKKLFEIALIEPAMQANELCIVSGFATASMVYQHLEQLNKHLTKNIKLDLIVGMTPLNGIQEIQHKNFKNLMDSSNDFTCSYIKSAPVHAKVYVWLNNGIPVKAFIGSSNYTITGFKSKQVEVLSECDPNEAYDFYKSLISESIYCNHIEAERFSNNKKIFSDITEVENINIPQNESNEVRLPLFSERDDKIHAVSGLNWGQREGREKNQAYIPIPSKIAQSDFFPEKGQHFSVLTDDGFPFVCVRAQDGSKAIETPHDNSILGKYFRKKLGLPLGSFVSLEDLDRFGSRYVKFTKLDEEDYLMSFTPENQNI